MKPERIIQFGEGVFLRGFFDDFIQQLNDQNIYNGSIVVIQPRNGNNIDILNRQKGQYNLFLQGLENGEKKIIHRKINCISRGINTYTEFDHYLNLATQKELRFIVSNTTESGIQVNPADLLSDEPASTFPGKLTQLLLARFTLKGQGFIVLPCELIDKNGSRLKKAVLDYAQLWNLPIAFTQWIHDENIFLNTLVDRIVTGYPTLDDDVYEKRIGYHDALINTAELYHLWVIEGNIESELPLQASGLNVIYTDQLDRYKERKVRILNGAHTCLVPIALSFGYSEVKESLENVDVSEFIHHLIFDEIIPTLDCPQDECIQYAHSVLERFNNPYLHHKLSSIALNSFDKFKVRVIPSILMYQTKYKKLPQYLMQAFDAFYEFYQTQSVQDDPKIVEFVRTHTKEEVFKTLCE